MQSCGMLVPTMKSDTLYLTGMKGFQLGFAEKAEAGVRYYSACLYVME